MLLDEARIQGSVEHPNVVSVIDVVARSGEIFIVLDLVNGLSLSEIVQSLRERGARVPPSIAVAIATDVLEGLHAAHELRAPEGEPLAVVHRDVSPHNVLVGGDGVSRILDFGVAKAMARCQVTRGGQLKGKPSYMSPEQLDGGPLDRRSDAFSLALVLGEMLTARRVCPETEPAQVRRWMSRELGEEVSRLASPDPLAPLRAPLLACLALDRALRPPSARAAAVLLCGAQRRATAAEVSLWLEEVASPALEERRAMLARLRAAAAAHVVTMPTEPAASAGRDEPARLLAARTSGTARRRAMAATGAVLALGGFVCGRATPSRHGAEVAIAERAAVPTAVQSVLAASVPRPAGPASYGPAPAFVPAVAVSLADPPRRSFVAQPSAPPSGRMRPATGPVAALPAEPVDAASAGGGHVPACEPPYVTDAAGVRVFKPECL
jgi:serine/threonine-protein kinase